MQSDIEYKVRDLLDEKFQEAEFEDCFLVETKLHANHKLEIFIDSDSGLTFAKCQQVSRYLEKHIDEHGWLGEKYVLEVSSPGIGRPLKFERQYKKNVGRKLEVVRNEEEELTGTLTEVSGEGITLERKIRVKEGKRKVNKVEQIFVPFDHIKKATVKVTF